MKPLGFSIAKGSFWICWAIALMYVYFGKMEFLWQYYWHREAMDFLWVKTDILFNEEYLIEFKDSLLFIYWRQPLQCQLLTYNALVDTYS